MHPDGRPLIHRVRFVLVPSRTVTLHVQHAGLIYALLAAAYGRAFGTEDVLPDGVMLDVPDVGRTRVAAGEPFGFGFTLLADSPETATARVDALARGLRELGRTKPARPLAFAGNFKLAETHDLVAGCLRPDNATVQPLQPIPESRIEAEAERIAEAGTVTIRFTSALRMMRPKPHRRKGRECFDAEYFEIGLFLLRTMRRLHELGLWADPSDEERQQAWQARVIENRLVWMDFAYGGLARDKMLAGAMGRVRVAIASRDHARALAWGQHVRVGQATRFGQGAFRIEEAGPDLSACPRSQSLLDSALAELDLDEAAQTYELPAGSIRRAAALIRKGKYAPREAFRLPIVQADGRSRVLAIPSRLDRALQRALLRTLAPALDRLLEDASVAYRAGLGRESAAKRVQKAYAEGFAFGLRADFRRFFDSVDHALLRDRLDACLSDDALVNLLMRWVESGSPAPGVGIPTGAPISPLLANLFLDAFDEEIAADGGRLVRYADDFVILYRTLQEADRVFATATRVAEALELALNEKKTRQVEIGSFEFLGYRFERRDRWIAEPTGAPRPISELGWRESGKSRAEPTPLPLPGENDQPGPDDRAWVVVGPGASALRIEGDQLLCTYGDGSETRVSLERIHELLVLGHPTFGAGVFRQLLDGERRVLVADDRGRFGAVIAELGTSEIPEAVTAQVDLSRDASWKLGLARVILSAKISNYAALAQASEPQGGDGTTAPALRDLAQRALRAESLDSLRGVEGSAAARWYRAFAQRLPEWCRFERRVAPDADDPGNAMLNLAMTALHRQLLLAIRLAGLVPTIGIFHADRPGHATLASDLQEPFRHLMDRAILVVARTLKPSDFTRTPPHERADLPLRIEGPALRRIVATVHAAFAQPCVSAGRNESCTYRTHMLLLARSLRRHLADRNVAFDVFRHPDPALPGALPAALSPPSLTAPSTPASTAPPELGPIRPPGSPPAGSA